MAPPSQRDVILGVVREYLKAARVSESPMRLTKVALAKLAGCSRTTLDKYWPEIEAEVTAARDATKPRRKKLGRSAAEYERRYRAALAQAQEWEQLYRGLLERIVQIEYHLRLSPHVDLDQIYASPVPPPDRSSPGGRAHARFMGNRHR